ncbi:MAG: hypothetical protein JWM36_4833 [Hyphomicrobiales bacterium]|nr:hypothetical protein [Hyphomicrobiales bacterium]
MAAKGSAVIGIISGKKFSVEDPDLSVLGVLADEADRLGSACIDDTADCRHRNPLNAAQCRIEGCVLQKVCYIEIDVRRCHLASFSSLIAAHSFTAAQANP